jgi:hypothetical protein
VLSTPLGTKVQPELDEVDNVELGTLALFGCPSSGIRVMRPPTTRIIINSSEEFLRIMDSSSEDSRCSHVCQDSLNS